MIDRNKIPPPQIRLTEMAAQQLQLMLDHDPTLQGKCMRIHVEGKGCKGFRYVLGIGEIRPEDFISENGGIAIHLDPFCAFYLQRAEINYVVLESGQDGFIVEAQHQDEFQGKFWKRNQQLIPPQRSSDHG